MTKDDVNSPTDAELWQLHMQMPGVHKNPIDFARAVLAKWGTPPAVAGEPVAWLSTDCIGERYLCFTKPNDSDPARPLVFGDTTPQPTQAQAGAVPLTCEWTHNADDSFWDTECGQSWRFDDGGPKENHMNFCHCCGKPLRIKGGQHG